VKIREGLKSEGLKSEGLKSEGLKSRNLSKDSDSDITEDLNVNVNVEHLMKKNFEKMTKDMIFTKNEDELTLECILNVLDGIVELYDVVVFFTTNDIDIIDPALKRKGRVDNIINMKKASHKCIREMLFHRFQLSEIYSADIYSEKIERLPEYTIAYSDISQICNQSKTLEECFQKFDKILQG
jgi:ATP-dependent Zn protease